MHRRTETHFRSLDPLLRQILENGHPVELNKRVGFHFDSLTLCFRPTAVILLVLN